VSRGQEKSSRGSDDKKKAMGFLHGFFVLVDRELLPD
jgi:hypothetical protein